MESFENITEDEFEEKISIEVERASDTFSEEERRTWGSISASWGTASNIVKKVKPIPWIIWVMIRSVYGGSSKSFSADPMTFVPLENLLLRAVQDDSLANEEFKITPKSITAAMKLLGPETAASLCFMHSVCMRVSRTLNERIYRAIIDDALIRARLGVNLGQCSDYLDIGRPLLAGFAGRAGLAVQLASGSEEQAKKALNSLATGKDISKMGHDVYGCDPLQVAALTLVAAGCNRNIAFGVASFSLPSNGGTVSKEQDFWYKLFATLEYIRLNKIDWITPDIWLLLGFDDAGKEELLNQSQDVFRNGHGFAWVTTKLSQMI